MISRIVKAELRVISRSRTLRVRVLIIVSLYIERKNVIFFSSSLTGKQREASGLDMITRDLECP